MYVRDMPRGQLGSMDVDSLEVTVTALPRVHRENRSVARGLTEQVEI